MQKKYAADYRLMLINEYLSGKSKTGLAKLHGVPQTLLTKWISHYELLGSIGSVHFNLPSNSTLLNWSRKVEKFGVDGLQVGKRLQTPARRTDATIEK